MVYGVVVVAHGVGRMGVREHRIEVLGTGVRVNGVGGVAHGEA